MGSSAGCQAAPVRSQIAKQLKAVESYKHQSFEPMMSARRRLAKEDYTIAIICALPHETAAASGMLQDIHEDLQEQDALDHNCYILGSIHNHNLVIASLPAGVYGTTSAATVAKDVQRTFRSLRFGLMVGIGGGAPSADNDIRLGDVVVSQPHGTSGGVIQYDRGKRLGEQDIRQAGKLHSPPQVLLTALTRLQAEHEKRSNQIPLLISEMVQNLPKMDTEYTYPAHSHDRLFYAEYEHPESNSTCDACDPSQEVRRKPRKDASPKVHYGNIASGNQVIKHGLARERLRKEFDVLCFEMEAAGLMEEFPCLVIRGISDYADSHKNKNWQKYAAATAAAFAKELLLVMSANQLLSTPNRTPGSVREISIQNDEEYPKDEESPRYFNQDWTEEEEKLLV